VCRRVLWVLCACLLPVTAQATPSIGANSGWQVSGAGSPNVCTMSLTVSSGDNVIVALAQTSSDSTATYAVSDGSNGAYTEATSARSEAQSIEYNIWYFLNTTGAAITITATTSDSTQLYDCIGVIVNTAGGTTLTLDTADHYDDGGSAQTAHKSSSAGINTAAQVIVFSGGVLSSNGTAITAGAGYTQVVAAATSNRVFLEYLISATAVTPTTGAFTSTASRQGTNSMASFAESSSGGGGSAGRQLLLGVGR
jgi:hypothetical protein